MKMRVTRMNANGDWVGVRDSIHDYLLVFVEQGSLHLETEEYQGVLQAGSLFWLGGGVLRQIRNASSTNELRTIRCRFQLGDARAEEYVKLQYLFENAWGYKDVLDSLLHWFRKNKESDAIRYLLYSLLTRIVEEKDQNQNSVEGLNLVQRQKLEECLNDKLLKGLMPSDLASSVELSTDHFARLFKKSYGTTPQAYLKREKMSVASVMLEETLKSVKEVSYEIGIGDVSLFCRQFKSVYGCTPKMYRSQL